MHAAARDNPVDRILAAPTIQLDLKVQVQYSFVRSSTGASTMQSWQYAGLIIYVLRYVTSTWQHSCNSYTLRSCKQSNRTLFSTQQACWNGKRGMPASWFIAGSQAFHLKTNLSHQNLLQTGEVMPGYVHVVDNYELLAMQYFNFAGYLQIFVQSAL